MNQKTLGSLITTLLVIVLIIVLLPVIFWIAIILLVIFAVFAIYIYFRSRKFAKQFMYENQTETGGFKHHHHQSESESKTTISPDVIDAEFTVKKKEINE